MTGVWHGETVRWSRRTEITQTTQVERWRLIAWLMTAHIETESMAKWLKPREEMPSHCCLTDKKAKSSTWVLRSCCHYFKAWFWVLKLCYILPMHLGFFSIMCMRVCLCELINPIPDGDHFPGHRVCIIFSHHTVCSNLRPCGWPSRWLLELAAPWPPPRMKLNTMSPAAITRHHRAPKQWPVSQSRHCSVTSVCQHRKRTDVYV